MSRRKALIKTVFTTKVYLNHKPIIDFKAMMISIILYKIVRYTFWRGSNWLPPGQIQEYEPNEFSHWAFPQIWFEPLIFRFGLLACWLTTELDDELFLGAPTLKLLTHSLSSTHSLKTEFNTNPSGQMHLLKQKKVFEPRLFQKFGKRWFY